ncbi:LamG-like jellyroll fold domain-containing protein [Christiangramia salexigens]|uniref:Ig-like domain-containing protein n=1 Tax=Christiangramia salexigens TaxID=1913577 RepID=A0A1L3J507_9FLAO|nr:LamG-like jellyroll fold domain-containing protein [Christiangramia salexigens]APG60217.1 hypothetical protein LPB144_07255 [Christiangramia salexigens]
MGKKLLFLNLLIFIFPAFLWGQCPASIGITSDEGNTICEDTPVTFTASLQDNSTYNYEWYLNGSPQGIDDYAYGPLSTLNDGDQIKVVITNASGTACNVESSLITMVVNPNRTPTVSINASDNDICIGDSVTFTASNTNGGSNPTYAWFIGTSTTAEQTGSSNTFITTALNPSENTVRVELTTSISCYTEETVDATSESINVKEDSSITLDTSDDISVCIDTAIPNPIEYTIGGGATGATVTGLPNGVNGSYDSGTGKYIISGTPDTAGVFSFTVSTTGPCNQSDANGTITVDPDATLTLDSGSNEQTVCLNENIDSINYTIGGTGTNATITWSPSDPGLTTNYNTGNYSISGASPTEGTFNYILTATGDCGDSQQLSGTIIILADASLTLNSGSEIQTVCIAEDITPIVYNIGGSGDDVNLTWGTTDPGLTITNNIASDGTYTIEGSSNSVGTFDYTITATGNCADSATSSGSITIQPDTSLNPTTATDQTVCINSALSDIIFDVTGDPSDVSSTGLPPGVLEDFNPATNTYTISGTPTATGNFIYEVTADGSCIDDTFNGTISVAPDATLVLDSGSDNQTVCEGENITPIVYNIGGSGDDANLTWITTDPGLTITNNISGDGTYTIEGSSNSVGTFDYNITATGDCKESATLSGSITIQPDTSLNPTTATDQTVCINSALSDIIFDVTGDPSDVSATGLPPGVLDDFDPATNIYTISGTPTATGDFIYEVTADGACIDDTYIGTISVNPDATLSLSSGEENQSVCEGENLTPIVYNIGGSGNDVTLSWATTDPGLTITNNIATDGTFTISGSTSNVGTFDYDITATGICGDSSTSSGSIEILQNATLSLTTANDNQQVCANTPIQDIIHDTVGTASVIDLPPGVLSSINNNQLRIYGSSSVPGIYNYTVTSTGCGPDAVRTGSIEIYSLPQLPSNGAPPAENQIDGPTSICPTVSGLVYSVLEDPNVVTYNWSLPSGFNITSGDGTHSITVDATSTATDGNISVTAENPCGTTPSVSIAVSAAPYAEVMAGADQTVCVGTSTITLNGGTGGAVGSQHSNWDWSDGSGNTNNFQNERRLDTDYNIPEPIRSNGGSITITITSTDPVGSCDVVSDSMILTVLPDPTADISGSTNICSGESSLITFTGTNNTTLTYNIDGGTNETIDLDETGTASLDTGILNATTTYNLVSVRYTADPACSQNLSGSTTITVDELTTVEAGGPDTICESDSPTALTLGGASIGGGATQGAWSIISGGGTLSSTAETSNPDQITYTPDANYNGEVILRLTTNTTGTCPANFDDRSITIDPAPALDPGEDINVCQSSTPDPITLSGATLSGSANTGAWSITSGGGNLSSNAQTANPELVTYTPDADYFGTVTLTLTTDAPGVCAAISATRNIIVEEAPIADAGADEAVCQSATPGAITLSDASISGGATEGSWTIQSGSGILSNTAPTSNPELVTFTPDPDFTGTVELKLTTNAPTSCNSVDDIKIITVDPAPIVEAGNNINACQSSTPSPITLTEAVLSGGANTAAWSISSGTGSLSSTAQTANPETITFTPVPDNLQDVVLVLTSDAPGACGEVSDTLTIIFEEAPLVEAGDEIIVCQSATPSAINLTGASISGGATEATWSITSGSGTLSDTGVTNTPEAVQFTPDANYFGSITLSLTTDASANCSPVIDTRVITIEEAPIVEAGNEITVCQSANPSPIALSGAYISGGATTAAWTISSGAGSLSSTAQTSNPESITYTPAANEFGTITLSLETDNPASGACGSAADILTINIEEAPIVDAGPDQNICSDASASISASLGGGATAGIWTSSGSGSFDDNLSPTAIYTPSQNDIISGAVTLTFTTQNSATPCQEVSDDLILSIDEKVEITTAPSSIGVCSTQTAELNVVATGDNLTYEWYKVDGGGDILVGNSSDLTINNAGVNDTGSYYVIVSGTSDCSSKTSEPVDIIVDENIIVNTQPQDQDLCVGESIDLNIDAQASGGTPTYQWRFNGSPIDGETSSTLTINNATTANNGNYDVIIYGPAGYSCDLGYSESATVMVSEPPTVDAGSDITACTTDSFVTIGTDAVIANYSSIEWSTACGTGVFGDINSLTTTYTFGPGEDGVVTLSLKLIGNATCSEVSDNIDVQIIPLPVINSFSYSGPICVSNTGLQSPTLDLTNAVISDGSFSYTGTGTLDLNTTTGEIDPSASDPGSYDISFTIPQDGYCAEVSETYTLTISDLPDPDFNYDATSYCRDTEDESANSDPVLTIVDGGEDHDNFIYTGSGSILSLDAATGAIDLYNSEAGAYIITRTVDYSGASEDGCSLVSTTFDLEIFDKPIPDFSYAANTYCSNDEDPAPTFTGDPDLASFTASPAGLVIDPSTGIVDLDASTPNTYTVTNTISASNSCPQVTGTFEITITKLPVADFSYSGLDENNAICISNLQSLIETSPDSGGTYSSSTLADYLDPDSGTLSWNIDDPISGDHTITYTIPAIEACPEVSFSQDIRIDAIPIGGELLFEKNNERIFLTCEDPVPGYGSQLNLSGQLGQIVEWEYRPASAPTWTTIDSQNDYLTDNEIEAAVPNETTAFRVKIINGACNIETYSEAALVSVIPADIKPQPVEVDKEVICIGDEIQLSSTTGYNIDGGNIDGGMFDNAGIKNHGWGFTDPDGNLNDFDSAANNGRADHWLRMNPHGQNPKPNEKVYTAHLYPIEDQAEGNGYMVNFDTYAAPAGNKGFAIVTGDNDSFMETPVFSLSGLDEAILTFDQAYNLTEGAVIRVEISNDGGANYQSVPIMHIEGTATSGNYDNFGDFTIEDRPLNKMEFDLGAYIGQSNLRIRFNYIGSLDGDVWAVDNIQIPQGPQDVELIWYYDDDLTDPDNALEQIGAVNQEVVSFEPRKIGWNDFEVQTKLILDSNGNNCQSIDNFETIRVFAFDRYTSNVSPVTGSCGSTTVRLNATVFAQYQNTTITSYPTLDGYYGEWEIIGPEGTDPSDFTLTKQDPSIPGDAINDPNIIFEAPNIGDYTFTWRLLENAMDEEGNPIVNPGCPPVENPANVILDDCTTLDFDGIDDYIDLGNNYNNFKHIEAWIRPEATTGTIISGASFEIKMEDLPATITPNGRWYHIAVNHDNELFVDGINSGTIDGGSGGNKTIIGARWNNSAKETENHFSGWIEEVRIWNKKLTQEQIRFMMNQRLKLDAAGTVVIPLQGEVIPNLFIDAISSYYTDGIHNLDMNANPFYDLDINDLAGYYRLISLNPDPLGLISFDAILQPSAGFTPDHSAVTKVQGRLHNITTHQENTSPTPYFSVDNGIWSDPNVWARQVVWDIPNSRGIDNSFINWNIARINHNIDSGDIDSGRDKNPLGEEYALSLLGLISEGGLLRMFEPSQSLDENNDGEHLRITHFLELNGDIDLIGESQLIQDQGSILLNSSSGSIERDQQGTRSSYNYNYWTSPVSAQGTDNNSDYSISQVLWDGTDSQNPRNDINYNGTYHAADHGPRTTPITLSTYWMWRFRGTADVYGDWNHVEHIGTMQTGEGYTMKGTSGTAAVDQWQNYVFKGKPHNGNFTRQIDVDMNYLLGNPYPSAMDADAFIMDNLAAPTGNNTKNIFNGVLYYWDHFAGQTHYLEEYIGGYAAYSLAGGVSGVALDPRVNDNNASGTKVPSRFIPVAQGFFLLTNGDTNSEVENYIPQSGPVVFQNSQRIGVREGIEYNGEEASIFLKPEYPTKNKSSLTKDARTKIRLKFLSPKGYNRQILVTRDDRTTDGYDIGFEAPLADNNVEDMYWMINDKKYVIQAVPNFNEEKVLPIGIKIDEEKEFQIRIDSTENWAADKPIYLKDKVLDSIHDLIASPYKNVIVPGEHNDRFEIIFQKEKENDPDPTEPEPVDPVVDKPDKELPVIEGLVGIGYSHFSKKLKIYNYDLLDIEKVMIFDMGGKLIQEFEGLPTEKEINLSIKPVRSGVYIVKAICKIGVCNKKIIIK